jgi:ketosteroid isomerase-like protein
MDRQSASEWLDRYVAAWKSYDREQIGDLFSEDVEYRYHPYNEPVVGRKAVVESWLGEGDHEGASERDEPGTYEASYEPVAIDGHTVVATGTSSYRESPGGEINKVYFNCMVMRFDDEGRCAEYTEWFNRQPDA